MLRCLHVISPNPRTRRRCWAILLGARLFDALTIRCWAGSATIAHACRTPSLGALMVVCETGLLCCLIEWWIVLNFIVHAASLK
jgi:hypothetical protein